MELYIKGKKTDLPPGAVFAVTVQSNDITKPDTVQSSYSNTLTLPYTPNNNALLDNANDPRSIGSAPYRKLEAAVLQDGVEVVPLPKAYLQQASDGYELQIFSGAVDFFERLGDKSIQELDLDRFTHLWNIDSVHDGSGYYRTWEDGYVYLPIDYGKPLDYGLLQASDLYPSVFYRTVLDQLFEEAGVKYEGLDFEHFNDLLLPFCNEKPRHTQGGFIREGDGVIGFKPGWVYDRTSTSTLMNTAGVIYPVDGLVVDYGILEITLNVTVEQVPANDPGVLFAELLRDNKVIDRQELLITVPGVHELKASFRIEPSEDLSKLTWHADKSNFGSPIGIPQQGMGTISAGSRIVTYNEEAFFRTEWALAPNLPDIKQKDFFKAVVSLYNLMPSFDPYSNTMRLVQMNKLKENKAVALDWSSKVVKVENQMPVSFRFGEFAQRNWWRYKADEFGGAGDGCLLIADEQLEAEKKAVELPFAASQERGGRLYLPVFERVYKTPEGFDKSVTTINSRAFWDPMPVGFKVLVERAADDEENVTTGWGIYRRVDTAEKWQLVEQQLRYERKNKLQPRIALIKRSVRNGVTLVDKDQVRNLNMTTATFVGLHFQQDLLPAYYGVLQGILDRTKGITPAMLLTAHDVQNYDCSIPVWLDQYQSYFYLNSINEFTGREPTECQLWRL